MMTIQSILLASSELLVPWSAMVSDEQESQQSDEGNTHQHSTEGDGNDTFFKIRQTLHF